MVTGTLALFAMSRAVPLLIELLYFVPTAAAGLSPKAAPCRAGCRSPISE